MPTYKDSVGNTYSSLPKAPPTHKAKPRHNKPLPKRVRADRRKSNDKYARYRSRRGKPNGPGQPGNKSGANKIR